MKTQFQVTFKNRKVGVRVCACVSVCLHACTHMQHALVHITESPEVGLAEYDDLNKELSIPPLSSILRAACVQTLTPRAPSFYPPQSRAKSRQGLFPSLWSGSDWA